MSVGCGTTRWTDTTRTATEQLLISDAVDRAVQQIDFRVLRDQTVHFDDSYLSGVVDQDYLISSLRQHLLASGCILKEKLEDATYIVEARAGAVGTDRHDLLYGVPATTIPSFLPIASIPTSIPEIPLAKRTDQMGVAKLAVFAYHRESGMPVWQSGVASESSTAKDIWVFGAGPFQKGTIYDGTAFAGHKLRNPLVSRTPDVDERDGGSVSLTNEITFQDPSMPVAMPPPTPPEMFSSLPAPGAAPAAAGPGPPAAPPTGCPAPVPTDSAAAPGGMATRPPRPAAPAVQRAPSAQPAPGQPSQPAPAAAPTPY